MTRTSLLTCAVLLVTAAPVYSQMGGNLEQGFENADANQDGVVSRDEYRASRAKNFSRLDRNGDGFFDDEDLPKRRMARRGGGERMEQLRTQFDKNGDHRISESEFANGPTPAFDRADADKNGALSAEEIEAAKTAIKNARKR